MSLNSEGNRQYIIKLFPKLEFDEHFFVSSPIDSFYNCLAYAVHKTEVWMWPDTRDGVFWPIADYSSEFENLFKAYETFGYKKCENGDFEIKYKKIALYVKDNKFTHAARQLRNGLWVSKLGGSFDIYHGTPYSIEGPSYGEVGGFMSIVF